MNKISMLVALAAAAFLAPCFAQQPDAARQTWWLNKTKGGVYVPPMKPVWKLSELKKIHAGQNNWQEQIVRDPEQEATYNSAAPGTKFPRSMHPDTPTEFVVVAGELHFTIEGQSPVTAVRGSIVNILKNTVFSYEVAGTQNALWVQVDPRNLKTVYPSDDPAPPALPGTEVIKVAFAHTPEQYTAPNQVHWNLFEAAKNCNQAGAKVNEDHLYSNPLYGFADPADPLNTCAAQAGSGGRGGRGGGRGDGAAPPPAFNPNSTFGHLHAGPAEWWIVQVGHIRGQFENTGEFHAEEGDVLYAAPMTWHQMSFEGPGPSCRLAMGGYNLINMNNTSGR
jgi:mannose-6-phosphate isomerase-like protein (cupin superfamily)